MKISGKISEHINYRIPRASILLVLFFASCVSSLPLQANVNINPVSLSFGSQSIGVTSQPIKMTLTNARGHSTTLVSISSSVPQFSYSWPSLPLTLGAAQQLTGTVAFKPAASQIYNGTLTFTFASGPSIVVSLSGTGVQAQPLVTIQPTSETVITGQTATFSASVSGATPVGYQWKKNGAAISGATAAGYTTPPTTTSDNAAQFTVTVSTATGSVSSSPATLTVMAGVVAPSITSQPVSKTVTAGQTATFSVAAAGTAPLSYKWMKNGTPITGATSSTYTTPATTTSDNSSQFTVMVGNSAGSVTSNPATLTVTASVVAPSITSQPVSKTVTVGQTATFSVTATGTAPLSYQWMKNGTPITGATSSTYTTPATTTSDSGSQFSIMVSNSAGKVTSNPAALTVSAITSQLAASPSTLSFGNINVGASSSQSVTLTNSSTANITISNVSISGPGFNVSGVASGLILATGKTATLNVTFAPTASGSVTGSVIVTSNATNSLAPISLSGTGTTQSNSAFKAWVAPSLVRVKPSDAPGTASSISLSGGRGEYVDTQIIVNAPAGGLTNVNMSASNLSGPNGASIAASNITFYREYYVTVTGSTPEGGTNPPQGSGTYPEPLIPFKDPETGAALTGSLRAVPATVAANQNQPFWIDLLIPRGASTTPPGTYNGTITVTSTQGNITVPVSLTVWNFELPLKPSELTHFTTSVNTGSPTNAQQQALMRNRIFNMNYSTGQASPFTSTWGLNRAGLGGTFGWNFVNCNGSLNDAIPSQAAIAAVVATYPSTIPLDLYAADENIGCPNSYANIQLLANHAHPNGVKILDTIPPDTNLYNYVDYWVMLPHNWPSNLAGIPGSFWSYASCNVGSGNSPAWQIDYPPINERMQAGFLNQTQGATGLLYWTVDGWTAGDAIGSWSTPTASGCGVSRPGDGLLIYPPSPIGSTESAPGIRLKAIRDGIQDYEYVQILKNLGQGVFATSVIQPIATSWNSWTHDPNALTAARVQLGQKLDQLSPPSP